MWHKIIGFGLIVFVGIALMTGLFFIETLTDVAEVIFILIMGLLIFIGWER